MSSLGKPAPTREPVQVTGTDLGVTGTMTIYPRATGTEVFTVPKQNVFLTESTTPINTSGGSFTGAVRDCLDYDRFGVSVYADVDGDLYVDDSLDGVTFRNIDAVEVTGTVEQDLVYNTVRRYMLVRYTTDQPQADFELSIALKPFG